MRPLRLVLSAQIWLALACCFPSPEQKARMAEREAAEAAQTQQRRVSVAENRAHLVAIAAKASAMAEVPPSPCDPERLAALRAGPPEGVDDTLWNRAWLVELGWLSEAAANGPSKTPPPAPHFKDHVSIEVEVAFRLESDNPSYRLRDLERRGDLMARKPPVLAVLDERRVQEPVLIFAGAGPAAGSFASGAYIASLSLWDLKAEELLCARSVEAVSSDQIDLGGFAAQTAQEKVQEDFQARVVEALNAAADDLSPGLKVLL